MCLCPFVNNGECINMNNVNDNTYTLYELYTLVKNINDYEVVLPKVILKSEETTDVSSHS